MPTLIVPADRQAYYEEGSAHLNSLLVNILRPFIGEDLSYIKDKSETVLINSNFNCGFYIDREKLSDEDLKIFDSRLPKSQCGITLSHMDAYKNIKVVCDQETEKHIATWKKGKRSHSLKIVLIHLYLKF